MRSYTPPPKTDVTTNPAIAELIQLLREETFQAQILASDLQAARNTNQKYLDALADRDKLIQEYIETIQNFRAKLGDPS